MGHLLIMPRHGPGINQPRNRGALIPEDPHEFQDDHGYQRYSGDDRHPGRYLVEPLGLWRRSQDRRRRGRGRRASRVGSLAHTRIMPQRRGVRDCSVTGVGYLNEEPGAPEGAGLVESRATSAPEPTTERPIPACATVPDQRSRGGIRRPGRGGPDHPGRLGRPGAGGANRGDGSCDVPGGRP